MGAIAKVLALNLATGETGSVNVPSLPATGVVAVASKTGFMPIPTTAAAPTGVPADLPAGFVAFVFCTGDNKMYMYNGAWKASVAMA